MVEPTFEEAIAVHDGDSLKGREMSKKEAADLLSELLD